MRTFTTLVSVSALVAAVSAASVNTKRENYPAGTREHYEALHAANLEKLKAHGGKPAVDGLGSFPFDFTSTFCAEASPNEVVNNSNVPVFGQEGAAGYYSFGINSVVDLICYNITLVGVTGEYLSPAATATHIHEAPFGSAGPPRLAFPNPTGEGNVRTSFGCLQGPFTTGLKNAVTGIDTGANFTLAQIEANPTGFFADVHTADRPAGSVRGQLWQLSL